MEFVEYLVIGTVLLVLALVASAGYAVSTRRRGRVIAPPPVEEPPAGGVTGSGAERSGSTGHGGSFR